MTSLYVLLPEEWTSYVSLVKTYTYCRRLKLWEKSDIVRNLLHRFNKWEDSDYVRMVETDVFLWFHLKESSDHLNERVSLRESKTGKFLEF